VTASEVLHHLWRRGFRCLVTTDGRLLVSPASQLTDADRTLVREHLAALRELLAPDDVEWLLEREGILIFDAGIQPHRAAALAAEMLMAVKAGRTAA
jgi:hypothetical protein